MTSDKISPGGPNGKASTPRRRAAQKPARAAGPDEASGTPRSRSGAAAAKEASDQPQVPPTTRRGPRARPAEPEAEAPAPGPDPATALGPDGVVPTHGPSVPAGSRAELPPPPGRTEPIIGTGRGWGARLGAVAVLVIAGFMLETVLGGHAATPTTIPTATPDLGSSLGQSSETPTTAPGPICSAPTESTAQATSDLTSLFMSSPAGYTQVPDSQGNSGPISLAQFTQPMGNPALAQASLTSDGYELGYRRVWDDAAAGTELHILLFKYSCGFGANDAFSTISDPTDLGLSSTTALDVTGIPDAWGAAAVSPDQHGIYQQVVVAQQDRYEMRVYLFSSRQLDGSQVLSLAQAEYNVLFARHADGTE